MKKLLCAVFLAGASSAWGQFGELWFNAGESVISSKGLGAFSQNSKDDLQLGDGFRFAFRIAFNSETIFGHEVQYAYSRTHFTCSVAAACISSFGEAEPGFAIHQGGYNFLIYATKEGTRFRPFATGGVMFANYVPPGSSATSGGGDTKFGFNYGGGVKLRVTGPFALRFDVRQYTTPKPFDLPLREGWLRQTEVSAGIGFVF